MRERREDVWFEPDGSDGEERWSVVSVVAFIDNERMQFEDHEAKRDLKDLIQEYIEMHLDDLETLVSLKNYLADCVKLMTTSIEAELERA